MACATNFHQELYDYMKNWLSTEHKQLRGEIMSIILGGGCGKHF